MQVLRPASGARKASEGATNRIPRGPAIYQFLVLDSFWKTLSNLSIVGTHCVASQCNSRAIALRSFAAPRVKTLKLFSMNGVFSTKLIIAESMARGLMKGALLSREMRVGAWAMAANSRAAESQSCRWPWACTTPWSLVRSTLMQAVRNQEA